MSRDARGTLEGSQSRQQPGRQPRKTSRTRFVFFLLLTWFGIALSAEVLLRLAGFGPSPAARVPQHYDPFRPDADLIWSLKPGWSGFELNGAPVRINGLGLRGPEVSPTPQNNTRRILLLGDSVAFGHGLADGSTISSRLEGQLAGSGGARTEVLNAGVPGYSTFQSARYYESAGRALEPDLVLLGFCMNDVTERYTGLAVYGGRRIFMQNVDTTVGMSWPQRLWQATAIRQALVRLRRGSARRGENYRVTKLWTDPDSTHIVEAWQRVFQEIDRLARSVEQSGASFAVVIFPYAFQLLEQGPGDEPQRMLIGHLRRQDIPYLDLLPPMKRTGQEPRVFFVDDNHFSAAGSAFVAEEIARFIEAEGLLAP